MSKEAIEPPLIVAWILSMLSAWRMTRLFFSRLLHSAGNQQRHDATKRTNIVLALLDPVAVGVHG